MKRIVFVIFLIVIVFCTSINAYSQGQDVYNKEWQSGTQAKAALTIRDKNGEAPYLAVFIVTEPNKKEVRAEKMLNGSENGIVIYPDDFQTNAKLGKSTWKCLVDNKVIVKGSFVYGKTTKSTSELIMIEYRYFNDPKF